MREVGEIGDIILRLKELEEEERRLRLQLRDLQKTCSHKGERGESLRIRSHFDGIKDVWVCSRCGKELKKY